MTYAKITELLKYHCPYCGAPAGYYCTKIKVPVGRGGGEPTAPHVRRLRLAARGGR